VRSSACAAIAANSVGAGTTALAYE
jgi:hypothetical protein